MTYAEIAAKLPAINASLNALAGTFLIAGMIAIKRERKEAHGMLMGAAFITSCVFLICYVAHKVMLYNMKGAMHTQFGGEGAWKLFYLGILISHIILAMAVPVLAIITIRHALAQRYEQHRKLAKITFPIWLYVSVTGVLVYFMLYVWFPHKGA